MRLCSHRDIEHMIPFCIHFVYDEKLPLAFVTSRSFRFSFVYLEERAFVAQVLFVENEEDEKRNILALIVFYAFKFYFDRHRSILCMPFKLFSYIRRQLNQPNRL